MSLSSKSKPDIVIDLNRGVAELFEKKGIRSAEDLLGQVAECCIQACDCCLQVSREHFEDRIRKILSTGEFKVQ